MKLSSVLNRKQKDFVTSQICNTESWSLWSQTPLHHLLWITLTGLLLCNVLSLQRYYFHAFRTLTPRAVPLEWVCSSEGHTYLQSGEWVSEVRLGTKLYKGEAGECTSHWLFANGCRRGHEFVGLFILILVAGIEFSHVVCCVWSYNTFYTQPCHCILCPEGSARPSYVTHSVLCSTPTHPLNKHWIRLLRHSSGSLESPRKSIPTFSPVRIGRHGWQHSTRLQMLVHEYTVDTIRTCVFNIALWFFRVHSISVVVICGHSCLLLVHWAGG